MVTEPQQQKVVVQLEGQPTTVIRHKSGALSTILKLLLILLLLVVLAPFIFAILFGGCGIVGCLGLGGAAVLEVAEEDAERERLEQAHQKRKESVIEIAAEIEAINVRLEEIKTIHAEKRKEFDRLNAAGEYEKANKIREYQLQLNQEYSNLEAKRARLEKRKTTTEAKIQSVQQEKAQEKEASQE